MQRRIIFPYLKSYLNVLHFMKSLSPILPRRFYPFQSLIIAFLIAAFIQSCNWVDHPPATRKYLVSSSVIGEATKEQLALRYDALKLPTTIPSQALVLYDIKVYKLVYKTKNPAGQEIQASGAIIVPKTSTSIPLISQQHGTILSDADAPSNYAPSSEAFSFASIFASNGFIITCPDYIGYGVSGSMNNPFLHTYEHREGLAQASLDMIRAAKEFIEEDKSILWDTRLYLTGYSEGGFATMSLYKKIQDSFSNEFNLRAVSAGAGAYDKTSFMKTLLTTTTHKIGNYNRTYLWVLLTYDRLYGLNRPLSDYFVEPYLSDIKQNGLLANLNFSFDEILTPQFKQGIIDGSDKAFLNAVADNNVYDWKPLKPLQMYHGTADPQVFYLNSDNADKAMKAQGSTVEQLIPIPGGDHQTSLPYYILGTYNFFKTTP